MNVWTELETTADDADSDVPRYDGFSWPRPRPTRLALATVVALLADTRHIGTRTRAGTDTNVERIAAQHARSGSGGKKLWASDAVSADEV